MKRRQMLIGSGTLLTTGLVGYSSATSAHKSKDEHTKDQEYIPGFDRAEFEFDSDVLHVKELSFHKGILEISVIVTTTDRDVLAEELQALIPAFRQAIRGANADEFFEAVEEFKFTLYDEGKSKRAAIFLDVQWLRDCLFGDLTNEEFVDRILNLLGLGVGPGEDNQACSEVGQAQYNLVRQSDTECSFERAFGKEEWDDIITNITVESDETCEPQSVCLETEHNLQGRIDSFIPGPGSGTGFMAAELGPASPDENSEICFSVESPEESIYSFTVRCVTDDFESCPPCSGIFPTAEFVDCEWMVDQNENYVTVEGSQQDVTVSAGEDLNCSLRLYVRGTGGECVTSFALLCEGSVTISSDVDLNTITPVPFTSAACS
jgi:hypothetical protein